MIIDCPSCAAQFRAPDDAVAVPGRKLRCSNCGHIWALGAGAEPTPEPVVVPESPPSLPADNFTKILREAIARESAAIATENKPKPPRKKFWHFKGHGPRGYAAAAVVLFLFILAMIALQGVVTSNIPPARAVYDLFGVGATSAPLVIDNVRAVRPSEGADADMIRFEGRVINLSETKQDIASIRIRLIGDKSDDVVASWIFKPKITSLDREQSTEFFSMRPVKDVDRIKQIEMRFVSP